MDVLRNNEGQEVLPLSAYNPVEPKQGVIFDDELYANLKEGMPAATQQASSEPTPDSQPVAETVATEPVAQTETQAEQTTATTPDYDSIVREKTAGKFEKFDDLLKALETQPTVQSSTTDIKFENEQSKQLFEYLQAGKIEEVTTFLQQQAIIDNVDKMSPADLLKMKIQMSYPDMDPEDVDDEFQDEWSKYGFDKIDEDVMTEEEINKIKRKAERKLQQDMNAFKQEVKSLKAELKLPELPKPEQKNELAELVDSFAKEANQHIPNLKEITIRAQVDKDATIDHGFILTEEDKAELANVSKDYWADFKNRYYKEGKYDSQSLARDVFIRNNFDKILNSAMAKAYMQGRLGVVMNVSNATNGIAPSAASVDVTGDAVRESLKKFILT